MNNKQEKDATIISTHQVDCQGVYAIGASRNADEMVQVTALVMVRNSGVTEVRCPGIEHGYCKNTTPGLPQKRCPYF